MGYDNLDGEDGEVSVWVDPTVSGFAHKLKLTSGDVLIENRSNREISFKATATINTHCVMITYDKATMEFDEALMNKQHRIAARMIWGDTNEWKDDEITAANSVNTGKSGVATTPLITIPAATNVGIGASEKQRGGNTGNSCANDLSVFAGNGYAFANYLFHIVTCLPFGFERHFVWKKQSCAVASLAGLHFHENASLRYFCFRNFFG